MIRRFATIYIFALLAALQGYAGEKGTNFVQESMYSAMNNSNIGMEFYLTFHPVETAGSADRFKLYITSDYEAEVTLTIAWSGKVIKKTTKKRDIIEFALTADEALCYTKKPDEKPLAKEVFSQKALHLKSDAPITVYAVAELSGQSGGYLALPVPVMGDEYIVASSVNSSVTGKSWTPGYSSILVNYDSTDVEITPSVATYGITAGETKKYTGLMAGDIVLIASLLPGEDLTGTVVKSSMPVGVISGNYCTYNEGQDICDYTIEMESPLYAWGKEYPVFPITGNNGYLLKILSSEEGKTSIFRNGEKIGQLPSKGGSENIGYLIHESSNEPVVISADKRINIVQYNIDKDKQVKPFQMSVIPYSQYSKEIYYSTPGTPGNDFYDKTVVNIIYKGTADGSLPDDMVIYVPEQGSLEWKAVKLSTLSPGPGTVFEGGLSDGNKYYTKSIELKNGTYRLTSDSPFSLYHYGNALNQSSYGFPASVTLMDNKNDFYPPVPTWTMNCDGSITDGLVSDMPENPDERSNMQSIVMVADNSSNYKMTYAPFIPGNSRTVNWGLTVTDKTKDAVATIKFFDRHGNDTTITIKYYAPNISISPAKIDFGIVKAGRVAVSDVFIKNNSATASYFITKAATKSGIDIFGTEGNVFPIEIKPGKTEKIKISFSAPDEGDYSDSLGIGDDCIFANRVKLTANALKPVISVTDLDFGEVIIGNEVSKSFKVYNKGLVDLVLTDTSGNNKRFFKPLFNREFTPNPGLTIKPGDSLTLNISFKPEQESYYEDNIVFSSDAAGTDSSVVLKGIGIIPGLKISTLDFGRRRIDRPKFNDDGPYEAQLRIENESSKSIDIFSIETITVSGAPSAFITDVDELKGRLNKGESIERLVIFHPEEPGHYMLKLIITYTGGNKKEAIITGTGVLPRLKLASGSQSGNIVDFGDVPVNRPTSIKRDIIFENDPWEFSDTLVISDVLVTSNINSVGTENRQFGTEGFYFEKASLGLPVTLIPGGRDTLSLEYISPKVSSNLATIKLESDAENDIVLELKGRGLESNLLIESNYPKICTGKNDTVIINISNSGNLKSDIKSVAFTASTADFSFEQAFEPFSLQPMESREIRLIYHPLLPGKSETEIVINSDFEGKEKTYKHKIEAESYKVYVNSQISPDSSSVLVGSVVKKSIILNGMDGMPPDEELNRLDVELNYGLSVKLHPDSIRIGSLLDGKFEIGNIEINDASGIARFSILPSSGNMKIDKSGEIATVLFNTYYPQGSSQDMFVEVGHTISFTSDCLELTKPANGVIRVGIICGENLKMINFTGGSYNLHTSWPNPAETKAVIKFSIALDAFTQLKIYNSMGQLIDVPLSKQLKNGEYNMELDLSKYRSGVYWYILDSGPYTASNKMVISK